MIDISKFVQPIYWFCMEKNIPKAVIYGLRSKMTMLEQLIYGMPMLCLVAITMTLLKRLYSLRTRLIMRFTRAIPRNFFSKTSDVIKGKFTTILDVLGEIGPEVGVANEQVN